MRPFVGLASGEPDRQERHPDARHVGEHVAGVGEEREAVGGDPADDLDHEDRQAQDEDGDEPAAVGGGGRAVGVGHQATSATCVAAPRTRSRRWSSTSR